MDSPERSSIQRGQAEIGHLSTVLDLTAHIEAQATEFFSQAAQKDDLLTGRGAKVVAAACILLAVRASSMITDAEDIASHTRIDIHADRIYATSKYLRTELGLGFLIENPHKHVDKISEELNAPPADVTLAKEVVEIVVSDGVASGKKARTIAGAAFYLVGRSEESMKKYTQAAIADAAGSTTVTIRNAYQDFEEIVAHSTTLTFPPE